MKKCFIFILFLVICVSLISAKEYSVSFFLKSSFVHPSFTVNGNVIKGGEKYTISDTDIIYVDYEKSDLYEVNSVRIRSFYDGQYSKGHDITIPLTKNENSLPYFSIGNLGNVLDISIECILDIKTIDLNLTTTIDGYTKETGYWYINGNKANSPYYVSANDDFFVRYDFDSNIYYLVSAEPFGKVLTDSEGSIIYMLEKANKISNVNYTVSLKPYTHISFKNNKHIQDIYFEDESIINTITNKKFKSGDIITVYTDRNYCIDKFCGLDIIDVTYEDDIRKTKLRIPTDNSIYEYNIAVFEQEESPFTIKLIHSNIDAEEISSILNELKFSITPGGEPINYEELIQNGFLQVDIKDDSFIGLNFDKPQNNIKISYKVKSNSDNLKKNNSEDKQESLVETFSYSQIKEIDEVEINISKGFRFIPESIYNDKNIGTISYYYNKNKIEEPIFIPINSIITMEITNIPENRLLTINGKELNRIGNTINEDITIGEKTQIADFEVKAFDIPSFNINTRDYSFDHGEVDIQIKRGNEKYHSIDGETIVREGDSIKLFVKSSDEGYTFLPYISSEKSSFYSKTDFENWIKSSKFVIDSDAYTTVTSLPQPHFWNVIYRYDSPDGEIVKEGDFVKKNRIVYCCYNAPNGFSCPNEDKIKYQSLTVDQLFSFIPKSYEEHDSNKPLLSVTLNIPTNNYEELTVDIRYADSKDTKSYIANLTNKEKNIKGERIRTDSPVIFEFRGIKNFGKALEITVKVKYHDLKNPIQKKYRIYDTFTFDNLKEYVSTENGCPVSSINVSIEMFDYVSFIPPELEHATIKTFWEDKELYKNFPMRKNDKVLVKVIPNPGFYLEKANNNYSYEFNTTYSQLEKMLSQNKIIKLVNVYLPNFKSKGLTYKLKNQEISPGWQTFKLGDILYIDIEKGKENNFKVIDFFKYIDVNIISNNFLNSTSNSNYSYLISEESYDKELSLEDFNCKEK